MFNCWRTSNLCTAQGVSMAVLTCVYPQVNLEVMGGAEGLATVWAVLGGRAQAALTMLGQRWLNAPRCLPHVLPNIWSTHKEGETNGRCVECHFKPAPPHITSQHNTTHFVLFFSLSSATCLSLSLVFPRSNVRTAHKVKRIKRVHRRCCFHPEQNADGS